LIIRKIISAPFQVSDLTDPAGMAFLARIIANKTGCKEGCNYFFCWFGTDDARPDAQHIHVIVLDTLVSGIGVMADTRIYAFHFVCGDTCSHPRPAQQNPALNLSGLDKATELLSILGVIYRLSAVGPQVKHFVSRSAHRTQYGPFQRKTGMVTGNSNLHLGSSVRITGLILPCRLIGNSVVIPS
jgi:hypothetical protein